MNLDVLPHFTSKLKRNKPLATLEAAGHPEKWGATCEFIVGLTKQQLF